MQQTPTQWLVRSAVGVIAIMSACAVDSGAATDDPSLIDDSARQDVTEAASRTERLSWSTVDEPHRQHIIRCEMVACRIGLTVSARLVPPATGDACLTLELNGPDDFTPQTEDVIGGTAFSASGPPGTYIADFRPCSDQPLNIVAIVTVGDQIIQLRLGEPGSAGVVRESTLSFRGDGDRAPFEITGASNLALGATYHVSLPGAPSSPYSTRSNASIVGSDNKTHTGAYVNFDDNLRPRELLPYEYLRALLRDARPTRTGAVPLTVIDP